MESKILKSIYKHFDCDLVTARFIHDQAILYNQSIEDIDVCVEKGIKDLYEFFKNIEVK